MSVAAGATRDVVACGAQRLPRVCTRLDWRTTSISW
jgi:hypothetical protein